MVSRGPPPISIRIQEGWVRGKEGLGDLVIGGGGGAGTGGGVWTWRDEVARLRDSAPEVAKLGAR